MRGVHIEVIAPLVSGVKHGSHSQPFLEDAGLSNSVQQEEKEMEESGST